MNFSTSSSDMGFGRYIKRFFVLWGIVFIILVPNLLFLRNCGEFLSLGEVVKSQSGRPAIYGTALHDDSFYYKLKLYESVKPEVVAIGSSRVMLMRSKFFNVAAMTAGGVVGDLPGGEAFVDRMLKIHKPELIILGVEFWWFNENWSRAGTIASGVPPEVPHFTVKKLLRPFTWLRQKKITLGQYAGFLNPFDTRRDRKSIGLQAHLRKEGFGPDGSYYYTDIVRGLREHDTKFEKTKNEIINEVSIFKPAAGVSPARWRTFLRILEKINAENIRIVIIVPPVAPDAANTIKGLPLHGLIEDLHSRLAALEYPHYDFFDMDIGSNGCEFIDGYHGGHVTHARMFKYIFDTADEPIRKYINIRFVGDVIEKYGGTAMIPDSIIPVTNEVDFLKIGCKK